MHPETFLRVLGPGHWSVAYVQPARRPADGVELSRISDEPTYVLEQIASVVPRVDRAFDIEWEPGVKYGDVRVRDEVEQSKYVFGRLEVAGDFGGSHCDLFERSYQLTS